MATILSYADPIVRSRRGPTPKGIVAAVSIVALVLGAWWGVTTLITERQLTREANYLRTANAPAILFVNGPPRIDAQGRIPLLDGRVARLEGVPRNLPSSLDPSADLAEVMQTVRAEAWGCT